MGQTDVRDQETQQQKETADTAEIFSGPQVSERLPELQALPLMSEASEPWTLVPGKAEQLQLIVFMHERTRPAFGLLRGLAGYCQELGEQLDGSVVMLTDDLVETRQWAQLAQRSIPKGMRMAVSGDGLEGPGAWGLNRNVTLTIVVGKNNQALANFAIIQPDAATDFDKVAAAIAQALGKESPTEEQRNRWLGLRAMNARAMSDAQAKEAGDKPSVDIRPLLAPVIRRNAAAEAVDLAAAKVEERAAEDVPFRLAVGDACRRIVNAGKLTDYGTPAAQVHLKKWADDFREQK